MSRPSVDVVVPFSGTCAELQAVAERMEKIELRAGDSLLIVDNSEQPCGQRRPAGRGPDVLVANERRTPGFARNQGAAAGQAPWLVFLDADTNPAANLLDRYFDPPPGSRTGLIGGGIVDQASAPDAGAALRYAYLSGWMSQERTFGFGGWGYPKSANVACRRTAFEQVGGFREDFRAAEDAELTYRLKAAGWKVERRESAAVVHLARGTVGGLLKQRAVWGAGGAALDRLYPGAAPARRRPGLVWWAARTMCTGVLRAARRRNRDDALRAILEPLEALAFELGRSVPNERPLTLAAWCRAGRRLVPPRGAPRR